MSTAQFTCPLIVTIPGQLIASSLWNNEFANIFTNGNPSGIGAYSDTDPQMQTATDPFPSGTSRPTSLAGELERIRYILNLIVGGTFWYNHPPTNLTTLNGNLIAPSGTRMVFVQAAAPTGWTISTAYDGYTLRVQSSDGAGTHGSYDISNSITLAHVHTVVSHTHDLGNHTHTMGNHTHSTPNHQHLIDYSALSNVTLSTAAGNDVVSADADGSLLGTSSSENVGSAGRKFKNQTQNTGGSTSGTPSTNTSDAPSTNTSGAASPLTNSQLTNIAIQYVNSIVCIKA